MILGTLAPLQKSHGVKDIAMRHWGVLRSSVREVGYLVVSSHTLPMLSTQIPFLHVYRYIIYKRKEISTLCSFVSLASDRINNTFQKYAPGSVYKTVTEIVY